MPVDHLHPDLVTDLNHALDESSVHGVRWDVERGHVDLRLHVRALPEHGPPERDRRRVLTLTGVTSLRILLRRDRLGAIDYGPPIPLSGQRALADFLASLSFGDAMYGGRAVDDASPTDDWPARPSLAVDFPPRPESHLDAEPERHSLYWFTDCGRDEPGGLVGYRLEGLIDFTGLSVHRADGTRENVREFVQSGLRWWRARLADDPRVSGRTQRQLPGPTWTSRPLEPV